MPSTYSNLKIQLMATGENNGTWGNVTNDNLGVAIEQALVETATITFSSANVTLTLTDTNAAQNARALRLNLTGTTGGARDLIVPAIQKPYLVNNGTADTITVKVSGQTGVAIPAGSSMLLYNNGTDVGLAFNRVVADLVGNGSGITAMNASEITTGSLANARTSASSSNGASTIVARDASGNFTANNVTVTTVNATTVNDGIGNVRDIPVNTQTTGYTLVIGDLGKFISTNSNVTVPNAVFAAGDVVSVYNSTSSSITVVQGGSVTLRKSGTSTTGNATVLQYGVATVLCTDANNFVIAGSLG